jgi:hypothetical protein
VNLMNERDEALDFIYKGFREGRQQRREASRQRGADIIADRRARMAQYGSRSMPTQNVASQPPRGRFGSSKPTSLFANDVTTPHDESVSEMDEVIPTSAETVSSPPIEREIPMDYNEAMARLDLAMGNSGRPTTRYSPTDPKPSQSNFPTPANSEYAKPENYEAASEEFAPESEPRDLSEANDILDGKVKYNLDGNRVPERKPVPMGEGEYKPKTPEPERYKPREMPYKKESVSGYQQLTPAPTLEPVEGKPTATLRPVGPVLKPKTEEEQHKDSFETAYNQMFSEENQAISDATNQGIDDSFKEFNRLGREYGKEKVKPEPKTPDPKPDPKVAEVASKLAPPKIETGGKKPNAEAIRERSKELAEIGQGGKKPEKKTPEKKTSDKKKPKAGEYGIGKKNWSKGKFTGKINNNEYLPELIQGKGLTGNTITHEEAEKRGYTRANLNGQSVYWMKADGEGQKKNLSDDEKSTQDVRQIISPRSKSPSKYVGKSDDLEKAITNEEMLGFRSLFGTKNLPVVLGPDGFVMQGSAVSGAHDRAMAIGEFMDDPFDPPFHPAITLPLDKLVPPTNAMTLPPRMKENDEQYDKRRRVFADYKNRMKKTNQKTLMEDMQIQDVLTDKINTKTGPSIYNSRGGWSIIDDDGNKRALTPDEAEYYSKKKQTSPFKNAQLPRLGSPYYVHQADNPMENQSWRMTLMKPRRYGVGPNDYTWDDPSTLGERVFSASDYVTDEGIIRPPPMSSDARNAIRGAAKDVVSLSPREFSSRVKSIPKDDFYTRVGKTSVMTEYLKDYQKLLDKLKIVPEQDIEIRSGENAPVVIDNLGQERTTYGFEPSKMAYMLAPRVHEESWQSMNDLFE